ncbi:predicted protein [Naegleria gruberi]|uniref:Predicted protein n=1 Tax=Naegleria gruberi TaxID=5762 RepID=D2VYZ7_NAEGR|nr:uncharacterized protein NAEGRDRAFT_59635 [Naegleria gruberi]EFC37995.1 predicted protein [Naegleria gruberi]|eukprot:XP_002670739.1 predicted protein [Naegleria gruberi strain NEG-M]
MTNLNIPFPSIPPPQLNEQQQLNYQQQQVNIPPSNIQPKAPRVIPLPIEQEQLTLQQNYVSQARWIPVANLIMSSKYHACSNMVHNLSEGDAKEGFSGVCTTDATNREFIQVSFSSDHSMVAQITRMIIRPCIKDTWGPQYLDGCSIEYKSGQSDWQFLCKIKLDSKGVMDITSPQPIPISTLRITPSTTSNYIGLGTWKFYGILSETRSLFNEFYREPLTGLTLKDEFGNELSQLYCLSYQLLMSSYYGKGVANTFFELMNDANDKTGAATFQELDPYIQANLKSPQYITHLLVKPYAASGWGFKYLDNAWVQYSNDGIEWENVIKITDANRHVYTLPFPIKSAYWRICREGIEHLAVSAFKLYTLKPFYNFASAPVSLPQNEIRFRPQISSCYSGLSLSYEGFQDESGAFGCGTEKGSSHYLLATFDQLYDIKLIKIRSLRDGSWGASYSEKIKIQYSENGVEWYDFRSADFNHEDLKFIYANPPICARFVKLVQNEEYMGVGTLKFYGDKV